jgi:hypothetical protein
VGRRHRILRRVILGVGSIAAVGCYAVFNEPWFLVEGCLWGAFALSGLKPYSRRPWLWSAAVAGVVVYAFGVLSWLGAAPSLRYG